MRTRIVTVGLAVLLVAGACNANASPTPNPQVAFCSSLKSLASAVANLKAMNGQDTIADIQSSAAAVQTAFQALKDSAGTLATSQVDAIGTAVTTLQTTVGSIPSTDTVDQAIQAIAANAAAVEAARAEAGQANCGEVKVSATPAPSTAPAATPAPAAS